MAPALPDGSTIEVAPRKVYFPGDVVAFATPDGSLRVHRVLGYGYGTSGWRLITKGDNAPWVDPPVAMGRVLGLVRGEDGLGSAHPVSLYHRASSLAFFLRKSVACLWKRMTASW